MKLFLSIVILLLGVIGTNAWSTDVSQCVSWGGDLPCPNEQIIYEQTICGTADRDDIFQDDHNNIGINILVRKINSDEFSIHKVISSTGKMEEYLEVLSLMGGKLCNAYASYDAPFRICYKTIDDDIKAIWCVKNAHCTGINCGGSGISVNSGGIL